MTLLAISATILAVSCSTPSSSGDTPKDYAASTGDTSDILRFSAKVSGSINVPSGSDDVLEYGILYGKTDDLEIGKADRAVAEEPNFKLTLDYLQKNTKYYYRTYLMCIGMDYMYGPVKEFTTLEKADIPTSGAVDLGLSVKWAAYNVGAQKPEEAGNYYAWGEVAPKEKYSVNTCTDFNGSVFVKYNGNGGKSSLDASDDVAAKEWGGKWRMPTGEECSELVNNCNFEETDNFNGTGVAGMIVGCKTTNLAIFVPYAGIATDKQISGKGTSGILWSSNLYVGEDLPNVSWCLDVSGKGITRNGRYCGIPIRPVTE